MGDDLIAPWKSKNSMVFGKTHFKDMNRIDGMPPEFERKVFPGITTFGPPREDSKSNERITV